MDLCTSNACTRAYVGWTLALPRKKEEKTKAGD